ncbi:MAG: T9SS type A sorting domain-containing protein, partial [Chitinophagaceae bacterium]|nr:T9SS type A sorting domain-containing protein [Chitinophagaceae bacterium]
TNSSSILPGWRQHIYSAITTLPASCSNWKFSVALSSRNANGNITGGDFYTEATINTQVSFANSSPVFSVKPFYYTCQNAMTYINNGAIDADGDSLTTSVIMPLAATACSTAATNVTFKTLSPSLSVPFNPLPTNNTFILDPSSGTTGFVPTAQGRFSLAFRINEYRNGIFIGSVMRDIEVATISCSTATSSPTFTPVLSSITGAVWNNGVLYGCVGQPLQMCFDIKSSNPSALLQVSQDFSYAFPGATISYSPVGDSVRGCLTWTPTVAGGGKRYMHLIIKDLECTPLSVMRHHNRSFAVSIFPQVKTIIDTKICPNESVVLQTTGGSGAYSWSILPGGTTASLSCTNCPAPVASPSIKTTYVVSSGNTVCPGNSNYADTVTVDIHTAPVTTPAITISVLPATTIKQDSQATFTATVAGCSKPQYQWQKNGSNIPGAFNNVWKTTTLKDGDIITCKLVCADTCPQPRDTVSTPITMTVLSFVTEAQSDNKIHIYPNPNNGIFTILLNEQYPDETDIFVENMFGQEIVKTQISGNTGQVTMPGAVPGVYLLRVTRKNVVYTKRFIVQ